MSAWKTQNSRQVLLLWRQRRGELLSACFDFEPAWRNFSLDNRVKNTEK